MRKCFFLLSFLMIFSISLLSQVTGLKWFRSIGGGAIDQFRTNAVLRNGNLIAAGYTESGDGISTGNHGRSDGILTCTSPDGILLWKKIIGGMFSDGDLTLAVDTTADGNIVMGITSGSDDGDITGNHGSWDIAFLKYTPDGDLLWSKTFGGSGREILGELKATSDGGIIASASTTSSASGNVTGLNHGIGTKDVWIIKLDVNGDIQWQRVYGGSLNEPGSITESGGTIACSPDGGYVFSIGATSTDGDLAGLFPEGTVITDNNIWLVKINASGVIEWQKTIGGAKDDYSPHLYLNANAIYILFSSQSIDGDLAGNMGSYDLAIFKYTASGTLLWKNQLGSSSWDNGNAITGVKGDQLTVVGSSYGTSFAGIPIRNFGQSSLLVMRLDTSNGTIKWLKSMGGSRVNSAADVKITSDDGLFVVGTSSSNDFDFTGNHGDYDGIQFKLDASNSISGKVYIDVNNNNVFDATDKKPNNLQMVARKNNEVTAISYTNNGDFKLEVDTGSYSTKMNLWNSAYYASVPDSFNCHFDSVNQACTNDIALHPVNGANDLKVVVFPRLSPRVGTTTDYVLIGYNAGTTTITSGSISLKKDPQLTYVNFSIPPASISGDLVTWDVSNFAPFDSLVIFVQASIPPQPRLAGITLHFQATILPVVNDLYPQDNNLLLNVIAIAAVDPNAKSNLHGNQFPIASVKGNEYIYYVIQFQNTGNAEALDILVKDSLSGKFQTGSIELLSSSHPCNFTVNKNIASWRFTNINLPDSNANEALSHGYITYRIKAKTSLIAGDTIINRAAIYFDFNPPVVTANDTLTVVEATPLPVHFLSLTGLLKGTDVQLEFKIENELNVRQYEIERSFTGLQFKKIETLPAIGKRIYAWTDKDADLRNFIVYYRIRSVDMDGQSMYSNITRIEANEALNGKISVYPNPIEGNILSLTMKHIIPGKYACKFFNPAGQLVYKTTIICVTSEERIKIALPKLLSKGIYQLQVTGKNGENVDLRIVR